MEKVRNIMAMMRHQKNDFEPIIIIGAGRSGTNMLRDIISQLPGFGTWPCDEINYIWRHGNASYRNDEFGVEQTTESVKKFIRRSFARVARKQGLRYVVEKTCANSLRVAFVNEVFPEAKFIFIVRDGRDVTASAMKRWVAPLDIQYLLKKARYLPVTDAPYYATRYLWNRIFRVFSNEKRVSFWGPRFEGMDEMLQNRSLPEVCAAQWAHCVQRATKDFGTMESEKYLLLKYEEFVSHPAIQLQRIADFLSIKVQSDKISHLVASVTNSSVRKWQTELDGQIIEKIMLYISSTLERYDYVNPKQIDSL